MSERWHEDSGLRKLNIDGHISQEIDQENQV
jgi:hypothetical protein